MISSIPSLFKRLGNNNSLTSNIIKMKKKTNVLQTIGVSILTVVLVGLVCFGLTSCKNTKMPWNDNTPALEETVDSLVQLAVADAINPVFTSADQAVVYRDLTEEGKSIDSVFYSMSDKQVIDVTSVLVGRVGHARKKDIVNEFMSHPDIYPLLPDKADPTAKAAPTSTEDSGVRSDNRPDVISTNYKIINDTVDGKPVKVQIREERSYVK